MAQLTIKTHNDETFTIKRDETSDTAVKLPPDGFVTFRGLNATLTVHVKSIASIWATSEADNPRKDKPMTEETKTKTEKTETTTTEQTTHERPLTNVAITADPATTTETTETTTTETKDDNDE